MAIAYVGGAQASVATSTTVVSPTYSSSTGNCMVVFCSTAVTGFTVSSITDTGGSTYTKRASLDDGNGTVEIWSTSATGSVASSSVTVTFSSGSSRKSAQVVEYSGVTGIGNTNTASGTGSTSSVSVTTQDNNNFVVAGLNSDSTSNMTASTGNMRITNVAGTSFANATMDNTSASPASVNVAGTNSGSVPWLAVGLELRIVSAANTSGLAWLLLDDF